MHGKKESTKASQPATETIWFAVIMTNLVYQVDNLLHLKEEKNNGAIELTIS